MISRVSRSFLPRHQPLLSRESYRRELVYAAFFPVASGLTEGAVISILAKAIFNIGELQFATIMAAPMFANLTSFIWSRVAQGERKIGVITRLQVLLLVTIAAVALLPVNPAGQWALVALIVLARCLLAGVVTLRSTVWRNNYPRAVRGKLSGHIVLVFMLVLTVSPMLVYNLLDYNAALFRLLYPICCVIAIVGIVAFHGIRLRREKEILRHEQRQQQQRPGWLSLQPRGETEPMYSPDDDASDPQAPRRSRFAFVTVLREDRWFREYMIWQMFAGLGNMTGEVAAVWWILHITQGREDMFGVSVLYTNTLPMVLAIVTLPAWATLLDQTHITTYRERHGRWWLVAQGLACLAALSGVLWVWVFQRFAQGVVRGGGMLAWQLGHNDFAKREMTATYMGIHVTLTGIRGAIAPFLGMLMVVGLHRTALFGLPLPQFAGIGPYAFLVSFVLVMIAQMGYAHMARTMPRKNG